MNAPRVAAVRALGESDRRCGVSFVGVGPGDEGLLTLRAVDRLSRADAIVVDHLDREELLATRCRPDVRVIGAGFGDDGFGEDSSDEHGRPLTWARRAKDLVKLAVEGGLVVRIMDGDPATAVGLAEEFQACVRAGIPVEVVPGVPDAYAVPAYAGLMLIPHGDDAIHVVHPADGAPDCAALQGGTVIVLGSAGEIGETMLELVKAGRDDQTPVVLVAEGSTLEQRCARGVLADSAELMENIGEASGGRLVAVVGDAAGQAGAARWFSERPLFGWRVLVPRTKDQAAPMVELLAEHGARSRVVPTISVEPPRTPQQMDKAITGLVNGRYQWIGFTSVNAVRAVQERLTSLGLDVRVLAGLRVAAVGEVTAKALREWGIMADLVPGEGVEQSAAGLLEVWPPFDPGLDPISGVFLPRADIATETLVAGLTELGWQVDDVTAYRTVRAAPPPAEVREAIKGGSFDAVVFTSSSTVRNLIGIAGKPHPNTVVACIGPATAKTAREHGLTVDVLAPQPSVASVIDALAEYGHALRTSAQESGEPVLRPSLRRGGSRRRAR